MTTSDVSIFQLRQVYRITELAAIYRVGPHGIRNGEGQRWPARWANRLTSDPFWPKAAIWDHLGLDWTGLTPLRVDGFIKSRRVAECLGVSQGTLVAAVKERGIAHESLGGAGFIFPAQAIIDLLGYPLLIWPLLRDDPAFTAMAQPISHEEIAPHVQEAMVAPDPIGLIDRDELRAIVTQSMQSVINDVLFSEHIQHMALVMIREELRAEMALQLASVANRISPTDVATIGNEVRGVMREWAANRPLDPPPTTALRDRIRGNNGR